MAEFLNLLPPDEARRRWLSAFEHQTNAERIATAQALHRVTAEAVLSPHAVPSFNRAEVDGYAVRASDTYAASEGLPVYLRVIAEVPMGKAPLFHVLPGQAALIHTGGMVPMGANAVVMLEYTQRISESEVEILRPVSVGEGLILAGEDMEKGQVVVPAGMRLRASEIGALMALGITEVRVARKPLVGILSTGDEIVPPERNPEPGQVRDVNSYTIAAAVQQFGGEPLRYGIVPDDLEALRRRLLDALEACDMVVITAGSSASTRDMTTEAINSLGAPGVLVHGVNTKPGRPTILGVVRGKPIAGLPGNPVSALINAWLFVKPALEQLQGLDHPRPAPLTRARLRTNLASEAGREDWWPVRLHRVANEWEAEPLHYKSNLIFKLAEADGLLRVPAEATGLEAGAIAEVMVWE
ncbi:MAG: molybdopterin-binding protein [Thermoflexales bacterium]|nr:molybdopterin-binding protein [Thermoflexales bacterium]MCS7325441.1 molybdopterin-binding protein [Thermoflexales bacterium]MCX7938282.1 molybdopterin-binding protein [Thermoflexales bacterium]MDW8054042.1 molybdopterin-binding protein [Anaerolineae bacterium]MDW8292623.1 molybdopterin-binding protein [Anaerolineae bacterium]